VTVVNFMGLSLRAYVIPILPDAGIDMGVARRRKVVRVDDQPRGRVRLAPC
jgi:hypothetical protein